MLTDKEINSIQSAFSTIGEKLRDLSPYDYREGDYVTWIPYLGYDDEKECLAVLIKIDDNNRINRTYKPLSYCARLMIENVLRDYNLMIKNIEESEYEWTTTIYHISGNDYSKQIHYME